LANFTDEGKPSHTQTLELSLTFIMPTDTFMPYGQDCDWAFQ